MSDKMRSTSQRSTSRRESNGRPSIVMNRSHTRSLRSNSGSSQLLTATNAAGFFGRLSRSKTSRKESVAVGSENLVQWQGPQKLVNDLGETVTSVCISCDTRLYAACGTNKKVVVYRTSDGSVVTEFTAESGVNAVVCAGDEAVAHVIAGTFGGWVRVYAVNAGSEECAIRPHDGAAVHCMSLAQQTRRLAVGGKGTRVSLYQLLVPESGSASALSGSTCSLALIGRFKTADSLISAVALNADASLLAAGGESRVVQLWKLPLDERPAVAAPAATPAAPAAAAASSAASTEAEVIEVGKPSAQFRTASTVHTLALAPSGHLAVGTTEHTEVFLTSHTDDTSSSSGGGSATLCEPFLILECAAQQGGVSFSELGCKLAVGGHQIVSVFDYKTGGMLEKLHHDGRVRCVALSPDGTCLVSGGFDRKVRLHGVQGGAQLVELHGSKDANDSSVVVRSVHLSVDSTLLAMAIEAHGKGQVQLYAAANQHVLLHEWTHDKAVWAVRLSPRNAMLAAAGYDMRLTLYSTLTLARLQTIEYTPLAGPAFIWSVAWSAIGNRLVVGCWNRHVYVYAVDEGEDAAGQEASEPLTPLVEISRSDRVYAVGVDATGEHVVLGGRDKAVAMYGVMPQSDTPSHADKVALEWESETDDFVYTVALSHDMEYVAFGGTAKTAVVLSARSGTKIFQIDCTGVVWAIALLPTSKGTKMAVGGESPVLMVVDLTSHEEELQLPAASTTYDVALTAASILFSDGVSARMYGAGGMRSSWQDQPDVQVVSDMVVSMAMAEEQLLHMVRLVLSRHPAVINLRFPETGASLIHHVITQTNQPELLNAFLNADCQMGLPTDVNGRSALHAAVEQGKWHSLQLLLDALRSPRFTAIPGSMAPISDCLEPMAIFYPLDFLHFIANFQLQAEPEVLGENDASDVMIPYRLVRGSTRRSPKGIWRDDLDEVRARGVHESESLGVGSVAAPAHAGREVELGYNTSQRSAGVHAYRVPFEDFAALPTGSRVSVLQLIVHAVNMTQVDYSIFGSTLVELLLDFKWHAFARRKYLFDLSFHLLRVFVVLIWNQLSSAHVQDTFDEIWHGTVVEPQSEFVILAVLWVYSTVVVCLQTRVEIIELCSSGPSKFFLDVWNMFDVTAIICQFAINTLFIVRPTQAMFIYDEALYNSTAHFSNGRRLADDFHSDVHLDVHSSAHSDDLLGHRGLRGVSGGGVTAQGGIVSGFRPSTFIILQAIVSLLSFLRLLYYFKGVLRLGALVHTMTRICVDILPLATLMLVLFVAFWSALSLLVKVELTEADNVEWHEEIPSFLVLVNMGMYADMDDKLKHHSRSTLAQILYQIYMVVVQVILLNMLIAIMAESNEDVRSVSQLVAQFERAQLILKWERRLTSLQQSSRKDNAIHRLTRWFSGFPTGRGRKTIEAMFPAWLHVLMPPEQGTRAVDNSEEGSGEKQRGDGSGAKELVHMQQQIEILTSSMRSFQEETRRMVKTMNDAGGAARPGRWRSTQDVVAKGGSKGGGALIAATSQQTQKSTTGGKGLTTTDAPPKEAPPGVLQMLGGIFTGRFGDEKPSQPLPAPPPPTVVPATVVDASPPLSQSSASHPPVVDVVREGSPTREGVSSGASVPKGNRLSNRATANGPGAVRRSIEMAAPPNLAEAPKAAPAAAGGATAAAPVPPLAARSHGIPLPPLLTAPPSDPLSPSAALISLREEVKKSSPSGSVAAGAANGLERAQKIASRMRDPSYTLRQYHDDITATFPELRYYLLAKPKGSLDRAPRRASFLGAGGAPLTSSGVSNDAEYVRTIGAFFAVYWLCRIGIDGERGFSFGVDASTWAPHPEMPSSSLKRTGSATPAKSASFAKKDGKARWRELAEKSPDPQALFFAMTASERAQAFYSSTPWQMLQELMVSAGLLHHVPEAHGTPAEYAVDVERMGGMLALTAVHDIMKLTPLLPTVQRAHAPYSGFQAGHVINDHDTALGYVLEHYAAALPSYIVLSPALKRTISFCTVRMGFNHGWMVQGEAPPGPLFAKFKAAIISSPGLAPVDVAFYFVHWLTDLAGAEPTPLQGSEKLVIRFPHSVLHSFINSFSVIYTLTDQSETACLEHYLSSRWTDMERDLGPQPAGAEGIALARLVLQAQQLPMQQQMVRAWAELEPDDRAVLSAEMSLTGIAKQAYTRVGGAAHNAGPAFLIYYSPAFLRTAGKDVQMLAGLQMLAEIYRQARSIWPLTAAAANEAVTVRIDQIKELSPEAIMDGHAWGTAWVLVQQNPLEGVVQQRPLYSVVGGHSIEELNTAAQPARLLAFWWHDVEEADEGDDDADKTSELDYLRKLRTMPASTAKGASKKSLEA